MYRVGEFSKMSKTTIKTLRYYDEVGILKPEFTDTSTGYRLYTTQQLLELHQIQEYKQIGLSIKEIKEIKNNGDYNDILLKKKLSLELEISNSIKQLSHIQFILSNKEEDLFMDYQATIKELPKCIVYSKKLKVKSYNDYFDLIPSIGKECLKANPDLKCTTPEYCFIIYLDGEYKKSNFNIEFCEAVDKVGRNVGDIVFKEIPNVTTLSIMHKGPYSTLNKAYAYAFSWIEKNGYTVSDNPRESYIDGIWNKENEEDWLTELQIPII